MMTLLRTATLLLLLCLPGLAFADDKPSWLFVISGTVEAATQNDLTIDASPTVIAFTDRPAREVRTLDLETFVGKVWTAGKNSFNDNPPNAAAIIGGNRIEIETLKSVSLDGSKVVFTTSVMDGKAPAAGDAIALVIDGGGCMVCWVPL